MRDLKEVIKDNGQFCEELKKTHGDKEKGMELLRKRCQAFTDMIINATNPVIEGDAVFLLYALETYAETVREHDPEAAEHTDNMKSLFEHKSTVINGSATLEGGTKMNTVEAFTEAVERTDDEIKKAMADAWTFPGITPPNNAKLVTVKEGEPGNPNGHTYYYGDDSGNYYYTTDTQIAFEKRMQEAIRRIKGSRRSQ